MPTAIGIDLGTTNSVVSFLSGSRLEIVPSREGSSTTSSVVYYKDASEIVVGEVAKRQGALHPGQVVRSIKRILGKRMRDIGEEVEGLPYEVVELDDGMAAVRLSDDARLRPEEVSADILEHLRVVAEDFLNDDVTQAVITVPAHFNDQQRTATKAAAEMAGLEVMRIINEPTAAAFAYGMGDASASGNIAVFDFGGGTFDISILSISNDIFEVLATNGDNLLGGDDVDNMIANEIARRIHSNTSINPRGDMQAWQRIREASEKAKCELSSLSQTVISLPFIVADASGPKHFEMELSREYFNQLCDPVFQRLLEPCKRCISDAGLQFEEISQVLLVGGSTRIPRVQELVGNFFQREPNVSINPDEAIAMGAAVQSGVISGALREVLLLDVTPLTLGIELSGGVFRPLIERNSTIPCDASRKFTTTVDNQESVLVHVLQGERLVAAENHSLAKFRLTGIAPAPKELPEVEVRFSIDANGILSVTAADLTTGQETGVVVENYGAIATRRDAIEQMIAAGQQSLDDDEEFVRFSERRAEADRLRGRVRQLLDSGGDILSEDEVKKLKGETFRLDLAVEQRDRARMEAHKDAIDEILDRYEDMIEFHREMSRDLPVPVTPPPPSQLLEEGEPPVSVASESEEFEEEPTPQQYQDPPTRPQQKVPAWLRGPAALGHSQPPPEIAPEEPPEDPDASVAAHDPYYEDRAYYFPEEDQESAPEPYSPQPEPEAQQEPREDFNDEDDFEVGLR